jgi:putative peptidoglycan lipid II flippase
MHDTKTPVLVGATAMGINVGLSFTFVALFNKIGWMPHGGLALANTLATAVETTILMILMRRRLKGIQGTHLLRGTGIAVIGTLVMCAAILMWSQARQDHSYILTALGGVALGSITYGLALIFLRVPETRTLFQWIKLRWLK